MIFRRTEQFESLSEVNSIPALLEMEEYCKIRNIKKIPSYLLARALCFFKVIYGKYQSECGLLITYNRNTKKFDLVCPEQEVAGASLDWKMDKVIYKKNTCVAGTIHSHADFGAFHSGTDDGDEKDVDGIHITFGKVNTEPEISCSYVAGGQRVNLTQKDIAYDCKGSDKFPADWLANVKKKTYGYFNNQTKGDYARSYGGYYDDYGCYGSYGRTDDIQKEFERVGNGNDGGMISSNIKCQDCKVVIDTSICVRCDKHESKEYYEKKYPRLSLGKPAVEERTGGNITSCSPLEGGAGCILFPPSKMCLDNKCKHYKGRKWKRQQLKWWERILRRRTGK